MTKILLQCLLSFLFYLKFLYIHLNISSCIFGILTIHVFLTICSIATKDNNYIYAENSKYTCTTKSEISDKKKKQYLSLLKSLSKRQN